MAGRFLLDTNIVTALFLPEPQVEAALREQQIYLSATVLGELYFGADKGTRRGEITTRIDRFAAGSRVLPCDQRTAQIYGEVKWQLRISGSPIPENDIWIAAVALQHDLTLATRDKHFAVVPNLRVVAW